MINLRKRMSTTEGESSHISMKNYWHKFWYRVFWMWHGSVPYWMTLNTKIDSWLYKLAGSQRPKGFK